MYTCVYDYVVSPCCRRVPGDDTPLQGQGVKVFVHVVNVMHVLRADCTAANT